ncbi:hypothetical protein PGT21_016071 [Puccinia graminis f. sp. tritici]|uniref:Uncharacterized protein n=1 Tax=Puccinia graminis f. sp. tritici TaxID=56615 RepID=A0A5B0PGE2_PUCGR|nr:hypothetical protein PGT21_016071 [Puccinia graminis f. sp. tritici]
MPRFRSDMTIWGRMLDHFHIRHHHPSTKHMSSSPLPQRVNRREAGREHQWDWDAIDGGPSSLLILLNWLTKPGNYSRWNTPGNCDHKLICMEILELMENEGITHQHVWGINHRIQLLRRSYNTARDFIAHAQHKPNIQDMIITRHARWVCPHWDLLLYNLVDQEGMLLASKAVQPCRPSLWIKTPQKAPQTPKPIMNPLKHRSHG